ncbi:hypothetical protein E4O93_17575 [Diaphorobacter sp. DS2]|nr:hypothetical protein E4O93_17575 [Diaphorobacter sp. DS2]
MLSAFSVEHCPPSRWNTVRHQHGIVSAIAWNTHQGDSHGSLSHQDPDAFACRGSCAPQRAVDQVPCVR